MDRRRHDNDATTKADKRGRRRRAVTTRRKIRGVAAGVCRISRGRRERAARENGEERGQPTLVLITWKDRTLCHPLPLPSGVGQPPPRHTPHRERNPAQSSSLNLCPGSKDQFRAFLDEDFQFYQSMTLLRGCLSDTCS